MQKLLLLSIVIATITLPLVAARQRSAKRALKLTLALVVAFNVFYLIAIRFVYSLLQ